MKLSEAITKYGDIQLDTAQNYWKRNHKPVFIKFKDLPMGARFKYPDGGAVWVVIEPFGSGLIAKWEGLVESARQSLCSFCDDEWSLDSEVEVLM